MRQPRSRMALARRLAGARAAIASTAARCCAACATNTLLQLLHEYKTQLDRGAAQQTPGKGEQARATTAWAVAGSHTACEPTILSRTHSRNGGMPVVGCCTAGH